MSKEINKKEASRKKSLGELGELFAIKALVDNHYEKIINLNDKKMNFPFADLYAEKEGKRFIFSVNRGVKSPISSYIFKISIV